MLSKYRISYSLNNHGHPFPAEYPTDEPVACETVLSEMLEKGCKIHGIHHEGVDLSPAEFDRMVKTAAGMLSTRLLCHSLGIDSAEAHDRFGSPA